MPKVAKYLVWPEFTALRVVMELLDQVLVDGSVFEKTVQEGEILRGWLEADRVDGDLVAFFDHLELESLGSKNLRLVALGL